MEKKFKTIDEQIKILKSRRMIVDDYANAYNILSKNNNYYLINGYKDIFLDKKHNDKYIKNTKIEEIYSVYKFDKDIKITFLKFILQIENEIKTHLAYEFSKIYGHKNYLILENFNYSNTNSQIIQKFIKDINLEIKYQYKSSNKMIVHYIEKYKYIPLWVLVRIISFGKISKFYSFLKPKEQNAISRKYNLKMHELKIILHNLTLIRNICAHDEKLYDIKLKNRIYKTEYHKDLKIKSKNGNYKLVTRDLFSIIIILKLLLKKEDFYIFYDQIISYIERLKKELNVISINSILYTMGFPNNYKKLLYL